MAQSDFKKVFSQEVAYFNYLAKAENLTFTLPVAKAAGN